MNVRKSDRLIVISGVGIALLGVLQLVSPNESNTVAMGIGILVFVGIATFGFLVERDRIKEAEDTEKSETNK